MYVYCVRKLGLDINKVNVNGGAIAFGHPLDKYTPFLAVNPSLIHTSSFTLHRSSSSCDWSQRAGTSQRKGMFYDTISLYIL